MNSTRKQILSLISTACALALAATCARAPDLRAQVQGGGSGMGNMTGVGNMASMRTLMSWMQ